MSLKDKRPTKSRRGKRNQEKPRGKLSSKNRAKRGGGASMPEGDGVLFPSTRTPKRMDKKLAKKLKKAQRKY